MPDISAISAALSSFNALKNIAQTMIGLHDTQALQAKVIDFNNAILDAQTKIFLVNEERTSLLERIGNLEKEVANLEAWETTKNRYELKRTNGGGLAWSLKEMQKAPNRLTKYVQSAMRNGSEAFSSQSRVRLPESSTAHGRCLYASYANRNFRREVDSAVIMTSAPIPC